MTLPDQISLIKDLIEETEDITIGEYGQVLFEIDSLRYKGTNGALLKSIFKTKHHGHLFTLAGSYDQTDRGGIKIDH